MTRRKQKFNRAKSRTMWLAWTAWAMIGGIFVFEDIKGGSGWLTILLTSPLWLMFLAWPFLWAYLITRRDPTYVEIDDDIKTTDATARMVQKDTVRYIDQDDLKRVFSITGTFKSVTLEGGDESFVRLDDVRDKAKENALFADWLAVVDSLAYPKTYY